MKTWLGKAGLGLLVVMMIGGAIAHVVNPEFYAPLVPSFIPLALANWASFVVELGIGMMLLVPRTRSWGGLAFAVLMVVFLPLHIWDLTKEVPAVGNHVAASVRLVVQFVLIWGGWRVYKSNQAQT